MVYRQLPITLATGSAPDATNTPNKAIDNNLSTRFASSGKGSFLVLQLDKIHSVHDIQIAWYRGDNRRSTFKVSTSLDGITFSAGHSGYLQSSGTTLNLEKYDIAPKRNARVVKIVFDSNTLNNGWFAVTEVKVNGDAPLQ